MYEECESAKSVDLVKKTFYCGKYTPFPVTAQHLCCIPVICCYKSREKLSITNIHLHALVASVSLEEKDFAPLCPSHFISKTVVQFHLQNSF